MSLLDVKKRLETHKKQFKVFSKDNCSQCVITKNEMTLAGVPFDYIKTTPQFVKEKIIPIIPKSHRTFPVIFVGDVNEHNLNKLTYVPDWKTWKLD